MGFDDVAYLLLISAFFSESSFGFNLGETNGFVYEAKIVTGAKINNPQNVGYHISADVYITAVWENSQRQEKLLKLQLENIQYQLAKEQAKTIRQTSPASFYVEKMGQKFGNVYYSSKMDSFHRNIYKGIASIFHYHKDNGEMVEEDISGVCSTSYLKDGGKIKKSKNYCNRKGSEHRTNSLRSVDVDFISNAIYELDVNGNVQEINLEEKVEGASNLWKKGSTIIESRTKLKNKSKTSKAETLSGGSFENVMDILKRQDSVEFIKDSIVGSEDSVDTKSSKNKDIVSMVKSYQKYLRTENLAKLSSASAFLKLLKYIRKASPDDIKTILENKKLQAIHPQILDLVAFGSSSTLTEVVFEVLKKNKDSDLMERFLMGISLILHPTDDILQQVMKLLKFPNLENKVQASALTTLGALIKTIYYKSGTKSNKILETAIQMIEKDLKACTSDDCSLMYLRGLRNAAFPKTKALLIGIVDKGGRQAFEAIRAIQNIGFKDQPLECERFCGKVLQQTEPKQETSTKAVAIEILLDCSVLNKNSLKRIFAALDVDKQSEYNTFIASKLLRKIEENEHLRLQIINLLSDKDIRNYFSIFQKGSSASFVKPLISTEEVNSTYGVDMEMLSGGLLKRSSFDINLKSETSNLHLISVGMFAEGMESFVGESSENGEESPRAGLELSILGVALRPYVFFESSSELMSHVWSGTASEPTPALQGNLLITDHSEVIFLQNGLKVQLQLQGVLSADLSGAVQISIWSRNSNSQVQNGVAFLMVNSISIETGDNFFENELKYRGEATLDFSNFFDFSEEPFKMCLEMIQSEFQFLIDTRKYTSLNGGKVFSKRNKKTKTLIPARSYGLHQKNSELCSKIMSD